MEQDQQFTDPTRRASFQSKVWPYIQQNIKTILADKGEKGNGDYPAAPYAAWLLVQHMDAYPQNQIEFYNALKQAIPNHPKIQFLKDRAAVNQWILQNANNPKYYYNSEPLPNPTVNVRNPAMFKDASIVATSRKEALNNAINAGNKLLVGAVRATKAKTQPSYKQGVAEGITADMRDFFAKEKPSKQLMSPRVYRGTTDYLNHQKQQSKEQSELAYLKMLLHTAMVARQQGRALNSVMRQQDIAKLVMAKADGTLDKITVKEQGIEEARSNPEQNVKLSSGMKELQAIAKTISDPENWAISMTSLPKLGINPQVGISEDTPKGIYFYPLDYAVDKTRYGSLPWGNDYPYIQLFQYDRSGEMTQQTQVDPAKLKQALLQYCPEEVIQQAIEEGDYDGTPYYFIYDCLSRLGKSDETNVVRWNKVLRDLGFTSVYDPGKGWIAHNEPTQGVVLDPRIIKQHKTISNRQEARVVTPAKIEQAIFDTMDMELARNRAWQAYDPDGSKLRAAAKEYAKDPKFKPWFGKPGTEEIYDKASGLGRWGAVQLGNEAWDWYKDSKKNPITAMTETNITKHMDYLEEK